MDILDKLKERRTGFVGIDAITPATCLSAVLDVSPPVIPHINCMSEFVFETTLRCFYRLPEDASRADRDKAQFISRRNLAKVIYSEVHTFLNELELEINNGNKEVAFRLIRDLRDTIS